MNELILELSELNPKDFFGHNNQNFDFIKKYFPKIKLVTRGNVVKAYGDIEMLNEFEKRFQMLTDYFKRYNELNENSIEQILTSQSKADYQSSKKADDILVHGVGGRQIKAQTPNQRKLVDLMRDNDMVFAIVSCGNRKNLYRYCFSSSCSEKQTS